MKKWLRAISVSLLLIAASLAVIGQENPDKKTVKGTVVAEYTGMLANGCYHVCGLSLVVKLDNQTTDQYVVVQVEYMDDRSLPMNRLPVRLVEKAARWMFEATLEGSEKAPLQKYMKFIDEKTGKDVSNETAISAWRLLKGAENEKLPFGEPLATYRVKVGKFKSIK